MSLKALGWREPRGRVEEGDQRSPEPIARYGANRLRRESRGIRCHVWQTLGIHGYGRLKGEPLGENEKVRPRGLEGAKRNEEKGLEGLGIWEVFLWSEPRELKIEVWDALFDHKQNHLARSLIIFFGR